MAEIGDIPVYCAHDKIVNISDLKPNPKNPNQHSDSQIELLANIIKKQGWRQPIKVSTRSGYIVSGHGRYEAALIIGTEAVPVDFQDYANEESELADLLADNRIAELAEIDNEKLAELFSEIDLKNIELTGYTTDEYDELADMFADVSHDILTDPDEDVEVPEEAVTRLGDIWQIGRHRLMCGDSTDGECVAVLMNGELADLVFTDPPYGMGKQSDGVLNDNLYKDNLLNFNKQWIPVSFENLKDAGSWYCWGIDEPLMDIYSEILKPMVRKNRITFRNIITWDKGSGQGQNSELTRMYAIADEKCLFVMCGVQGFNTNADNYFEGWEPIRTYLAEEAKKVGLTPARLKEICGVGMFAHWFTKSQWVFIPEEHYIKLQNAFKKDYGAFKRDYGAFKRDYEEIKRDYEEIKRDYYSSRAYFDNTHENMNNVWHFNRLTYGTQEYSSVGGHATPKPVALCERAIKSSSREDEIVLDMFGGSGSTMIACEGTRRKCRLMELEPKYCDVIVKRYMKVTGKSDITLIRDGKQIPVNETGIIK